MTDQTAQKTQTTETVEQFEQSEHATPMDAPVNDRFVIKSNPLAQGLDRETAIALATASHAPDKKIQARYHKTPHFKRLKQAAIALYGCCVLCGRPPATGSLTVHHRRYNSLFREHLLRDLVLICARCHKKYHGK